MTPQVLAGMFNPRWSLWGAQGSYGAGWKQSGTWPPGRGGVGGGQISGENMRPLRT